MSWRRLLRSLPLPLACALLLGLCLPVATGHWDPAWLRVKEPQVRRDAGIIGVPDVQAPFRAEQRDEAGRLLWRLTGDRVVSRTLYEHDLVAPRLRVFQAGVPQGSVKAASGEVRIPQGEDPWLQIVLRGGVTIDQGDLRAECAELTLRLHRDGLEATEGIQLQSASPVVVTAALGDSSWQAQAPSLEATLSPLDVRLGAPTKLRGGPVLGSVWAGGRALQGLAHGGVRVRGSSEGAHPERPPADVRLQARDLELTLTGGQGRLRADALSARWQRLPEVPQALLGGTAGVVPCPQLGAGEHRYALRQVVLEGAVDAALHRDAAPGVEALALALRGQRLELRTLSARAALTGSPARLEDAVAGAWIEAGALVLSLPAGRAELQATNGVRWQAPEPALGPAAQAGAARRWLGRAGALSVRSRRGPRDAAPSWEPRDLEALTAEGLDGAPLELRRDDDQGWLRAGTLRYAADATRGVLELQGGFEGRLPPGRVDEHPWQLRGDVATFEVRRQRLERAVDGAAPAWDELLSAAHLRGSPAQAARVIDRPRRRRGLSATQVDYADGVVDARGQAWVQAGVSDLRSERLRYTPAQGLLTSDGPTAFVVDQPGHAGPERYEVRGGRARATLAPERSDWEASRALRRLAKHEGARLVPPTALRALEVADGVQLEGPRGLSAEGGRLQVDGALATLLPAAGGRVRASWEAGQLEADRLTVWSRSLWPRPRFLVGARGDVRARLTPREAGAEPLEVSAGWLLVDLYEPRLDGLRGDARAAALRRSVLGFGAGGPRGVLLTGRDAQGQPLEAWTARLVGDARRAELVGSEKAPLRVARGELRLQAPEAGARLSEDGRLLELELPAGWGGVLPIGDAQHADATGARLLLRVDVEALRAGERLDPSEATLRRVLDAAEATGGLSLRGDDLRVQAERASYDLERGRFRVEGAPARISRKVGGGWSSSEGRELILTLD